MVPLSFPCDTLLGHTHIVSLFLMASQSSRMYPVCPKLPPVVSLEARHVTGVWLPSQASEHSVDSDPPLDTSVLEHTAGEYVPTTLIRLGKWELWLRWVCIATTLRDVKTDFWL